MALDYKIVWMLLNDNKNLKSGMAGKFSALAFVVTDFQCLSPTNVLSNTSHSIYVDEEKNRKSFPYI